MRSRAMASNSRTLAGAVGGMAHKPTAGAAASEVVGARKKGGRPLPGQHAPSLVVHVQLCLPAACGVSLL
jgi:hypothetical protein